MIMFIEDYPVGDAIHKLTLAMGVYRYMRFAAKLINLEPKG